MSWSQFVKWLEQMKGMIPVSQLERMKQEGKQRYQEHLQKGYAAVPLDFSDIIRAGEKTIKYNNGRTKAIQAIQNKFQDRVM
jgi:hypothetical protein